MEFDLPLHFACLDFAALVSWVHHSSTTHASCFVQPSSWRPLDYFAVVMKKGLNYCRSRDSEHD